MSNDNDSNEFSVLDIKGSGHSQKDFSQNNTVDGTGTGLDKNPHIYAKRWIVITVLSLIIAINTFCLNINGDYQSNLQIFYKKLVPTVYDFVGEYFFYYLHMFVSITFTFVSMLVLEIRGLKINCLTGILLACLGSWIRCATINDRMYGILFMGYILCDVGQIFISSSFVCLSASWFSSKETATSISVFLQ
jgi:hypothetical protein